jgi:hypothetical protein
LCHDSPSPYRALYWFDEAAPAFDAAKMGLDLSFLGE